MRLAILFFIGSLQPGLRPRSRPKHGDREDPSGRLAAEATFARADIEALVPLDMNHDGKVSSQEWQQARPILEPLLRDTLVVRGSDGTTGMTEIGFQLDENDNFHVAGILRAEGAKLTLESPLTQAAPSRASAIH